MELQSLRALSLILFCMPCWAEISQKDIEAEKAWDAGQLAAEKTIPALLESYGNAIGCSFSFNPSHLVKYKIQKEPIFVAVIGLDFGCSGGSAMGRTLLIAMKYGAYHKINVVPELSTPTQTPSDFPKHLERLYLENGEIMFSGFVPDWSKDSLCCASQPVKGKVSLANGKWALSFQQ
ncbi:hypothetical protein ACOAPY_10575 [Pseudomonas sp. P3C3]